MPQDCHRCVKMWLLHVKDAAEGPIGCIYRDEVIQASKEII